MTTLPIKVLPLDVTIVAISADHHHPDGHPLSLLEGITGPARRGAVMSPLFQATAILPKPFRSAAND